MLKIKLLPRGKKHQITYRVVVSEARSKYNGNFTADLGFFNPQTKEVQIDKELLATWVKNGAQVTEGVDKLLNPDKHPNKFKHAKVVKEVKEEVAEAPATEAKEAVTETEAVVENTEVKEEVKEVAENKEEVVATSEAEAEVSKEEATEAAPQA